jgi:hypothetical protein
MLDALKKQILVARIERLRDHVENVGNSLGFERELAKAESELRSIEQREPAR